MGVEQAAPVDASKPEPHSRRAARPRRRSLRVRTLNVVPPLGPVRVRATVSHLRVLRRGSITLPTSCMLGERSRAGAGESAESTQAAVGRLEEALKGTVPRTDRPWAEGQVMVRSAVRQA